MTDDDLQAVRTAIEAYAESELNPIGYDLSDPGLADDDKRVLWAEREMLYKLQRHATSIAAYANIRAIVGGDQ